MKLAQDAAAQELKTICESRFSLQGKRVNGIPVNVMHMSALS